MRRPDKKLSKLVLLLHPFLILVFLFSFVDVASAQVNLQLTASAPATPVPTGEVAIRVANENGITPNGTSSSFVGSFSANNAAATATATATTTASAISRLSLLKYTNGKTALNEKMAYSFKICNGAGSSEEDGSLNLQNVIMEDVLPAGATFIQFDLASGGFKSKSYDAGTRTAKWELFDLEPGECKYDRLIVQYDSPTNFVGETISNTATVTATPIGESLVSVSDTKVHNLLGPYIDIDIDKDFNGSTIYPSGYSSYDIDLDNDGTVSLDALTLTDVLPPEIEVHRIDMGAFSDAAAIDHAFVTFKYKTNLNSSWQTYAASPMGAWEDEEIDVWDLGLSFGGPEYLTELRWEFGGRSVAFSTYRDIEIHFQVRSTATPGIITNCAEVTSTTTGVTTASSCADFTLSAPIVGPVVYMASKIDYGFSNPFGVGDVVGIESYYHNHTCPKQ